MEQALNKRVETIELEIGNLKRKTALNILAIGDLLNEAKTLIDHGKWDIWLNDNVGFSSRTARNFMKISRTFRAEERKALADLDITKLYYLSELPEDKRAEIIDNNNIADITTREVKALVNAATNDDLNFYKLPVDEWITMSNHLIEKGDFEMLSIWVEFLHRALNTINDEISFLREKFEI